HINAGPVGYHRSPGLTPIRQLELASNGRGLVGEDTLAAIEKSDERIFDRALDARQLQGIGYKIRFHLHPDVRAELDMGGSAVSITLKSGEVWVFRHEGATSLELQASVFMEKGRLKTRASKQVVLSGVALEYATRIRWTIAKAQDTPDTVRDLRRDDVAELN
ncbi:MAG: heparinase II/III family protein, partial [Paracoccaceae bacterium]